MPVSASQQTRHLRRCRGADWTGQCRGERGERGDLYLQPERTLSGHLPGLDLPQFVEQVPVLQQGLSALSEVLSIKVGTWYLVW